MIITVHGKLHVGEKVLAYNPNTHRMESEPILHVWIHKDSDLVDLTITTNTHAPHSTKVTKTKEVLHTNQEHPFFTLEKGFVPVGQLKLGMHVLRANGQIGVITGWKMVPGTKVMYNLEVAHDHTFVVGAGQWVVHNKCDSGPLRKSIGLSTGDPYQAHHLVSCELSESGQKTHSLILAAQANVGSGYINEAWNGMALPNSRAFSDLIGLPFHNNNHGRYTDQVKQLLDLAEMSIYENTPGPISPDDARASLAVIAQFLRIQIEAAGGDICINDINAL